MTLHAWEKGYHVLAHEYNCLHSLGRGTKEFLAIFVVVFSADLHSSSALYLEGWPLRTPFKHDLEFGFILQVVWQTGE